MTIDGVNKMKILIVDDEQEQRNMIKGFLEKKGYEVYTAENGNQAIQIFMDIPVQLVLLDYRMPELNGDQVLEKMKKINPLVKCLMISAHGTVDTAVSIMKLGADDFLEKPIDLVELLTKIEVCEQRFNIDCEVQDVNEKIEIENLPIKIIGKSEKMKEILSVVRRVSKTPWPVLIRGETGTGKELIARLIHYMSEISDRPYIEANCAAIPENLFESELFGHEKGAFTGANSSRKGRFELAKNGSIFLDEIGELPINLQPKLLRVLQENKICRLGSEKDIVVDVRVIAATNRDLKSLVEQGLFREDLYYRLNVFDIELPSLRDRKSDIPELIDFFIERYSINKTKIDPEAMTSLVKYSFPGNVRELEHIIQRTVTLTRNNIIRNRDLPSEIRFYKATEQGNLSQRLEAVEQEMLLSALEKFNWIQTKAANSLGISERVLRYKMRKYKLSQKK